MKLFLKPFAATVSVLGFSAALIFPSLAQSSFTPGSASPANSTDQLPAGSNRETGSLSQNMPNNTPAPSSRDTGVPSTNSNQPDSVNTPANRPINPNQTPDQNSAPSSRDTGVPPTNSNQSPNGVNTPANRPINPNQTPDQNSAPSNRDTGVPPTNSNQPDSVNTPANRPINPNQPGFSSSANTSSETIDQIVRTNPSFELFNALLRVANSEGILTTQLAGGSNYTVFAPTDEALAQIPAATFKALVQPENRDLLARVLENHIVQGKVSSTDLASKQYRSLGGTELQLQGGAIGNARVIAPDIQASNGVIHVVNQPIIPADVQSRLVGFDSQSGTINQSTR